MRENPTEKTVAMVLAGGHGNRLSILAEHRAKPAVPFAGMYRVIDFTLSNVMRSGIRHMGIMTQYKPYSLMDHISEGAPWGYTGRRRLAKILPPYVGGADSDWYVGTADAIFQNLSFLERFDYELVLVLSGDHVYYMDYSDMINFHLETGADLTIAMQTVPWDEVGRFGVGVLDDDGRIEAFHEKNAHAPSNHASLGIYVFNRKVLEKRLREDALEKSSHDFGHDIIPRMVEQDTVYGYPFEEYWRDIGTVRSYWDSNMEILNPDSGCDLRNWDIRTNLLRMNQKNYVPAHLHSGTQIERSIVSTGCVIEGEVYGSILSPGVVIRKGAKVIDSIIFHDTCIGENSLVKDTICDKEVRIDEGCEIGTGEDIPSETQPDLLYTGLTLIGKAAHIPKNKKIGRNCLIYPEVNTDTLTAADTSSGKTVMCPESQ